MDKQLIEKINEITKNKPIFYVSNDAERALGLEKLLTNFHVVCIDHNDIVDYMEKVGVKVFCLEKVLGEKNSLYRNSTKLLKHPKVQEYINSNSKNGGYVMTFKISPAFEKLAQSMELIVLNTAAALNRKYENKITQFENLGDKVNFPQTILGVLGELDYKAISQKLGQEVVMQFDLGHTGSGTVFINDATQFEEQKDKFPKRIVRIAKKISGGAYTINVMVGRNLTLVSGLNYQITGVTDLTDKEGATVGNDFSYISNLSQAQRDKIFDQVNKIAEILRNDSYLGFFGIDLIVSPQDVYTIEINARQPASVPFVNKLQIVNNQTPMSLYHIATMMNVDFVVDSNSYNSQNTSAMNAGQIFLRNTKDDAFVVKGAVKTGAYRLQSDNSAMNWSSNTTKDNVLFLDEDGDKPLIFQKEAYTIEDCIDTGMLILTQSQGKSVNPSNELARIQSVQPLIGPDGKPFSWVIESLNSVKRYLE